MLRTFGDSRGFRKLLVGLLTGIAVLAIAIDSADARRRRYKRHRSYSPPYAAIVVDGNSGEVLHSAKADAKRQPASLTKIMTLYLLFERLDKGQLKLDSQLQVSRRASRQQPITLGLKQGQTIKVEDAILGLVTRSANDAAVVIAEAIAGDEKDFARLMTRKARALGMADTVYKNASGLPDSDHVTTARDQAKLARAIQDRFPKYYRYFSRRSFTFRGETLENSNELLGSVRGVDGVKTGSSSASGFNLVASMKRDDRYLVAVVFGSKSSDSRNELMSRLLTKYVTMASTSRTTRPIAERPVSDREEPIAVARIDHRVVAAVPAKPIRSTLVTRKGHRRAHTTSRRSRRDRIRPIAVKAFKVKLSGVKGPFLALPMSRTIAPTATTVPAAPTAATASAAPSPASPKIRVASASAEPFPVSVAKTVAPTPALASKEKEPSARRHTGWIIQVGAFEAKGDAKDRLRSARGKAMHLLRDADSFTEAVIKNDTTFYRARFAGFEMDEAFAACRYLKRRDFPCMTVRN